MSDPVRTGRPEAAAVIWREGEGDDRASRARRARLHAVLRAIVAGAAGALLLYFARSIFAYVAFGIGGITLLLGLASPLGAYAALERSIGALSRLVGATLTWLLLAPVFFLFMAPFGLFAKRGARDPLKRRLDQSADTYWAERDDARALDKPY